MNQNERIGGVGEVASEGGNDGRLFAALRVATGRHLGSRTGLGGVLQRVRGVLATGRGHLAKERGIVAGALPAAAVHHGLNLLQSVGQLVVVLEVLDA